MMMSQEVTSTGHALLEEFWCEQHQSVVGEGVGEPEEHTQRTHTPPYSGHKISNGGHPDPPL